MTTQTTWPKWKRDVAVRVGIVDRVYPDVGNDIDLSTYIGPLDAEPEPKTLEECLAEAGDFPFVARAVVPGPSEYSWPVGSEFQFVRKDSTGFVFPNVIRGPDGSLTDGAQGVIRRWVLAGHRT